MCECIEGLSVATQNYVIDLPSIGQIFFVAIIPFNESVKNQIVAGFCCQRNTYYTLTNDIRWVVGTPLLFCCKKTSTNAGTAALTPCNEVYEKLIVRDKLSNSVVKISVDFLSTTHFLLSFAIVCLLLVCFQKQFYAQIYSAFVVAQRGSKLNA